MINELFVVLMMIAENGIVRSVNHATAQTHLNVYKTQHACEAVLPEFVPVTYPEFRPTVQFLDHELLMIGASDSPEGWRNATWRCVAIFAPDALYE